jgi:hypothetical protein
VSRETANHSFDDLARAVAEGSLSRRRALKLFAGTAIAALIPSRALANDDDCVRICHVPFDRETGRCFFGQRVNRCVSRSERERHLENHPCDCPGRCRNCRRPMCQPTGGTCMANDDCCSGHCFESRCLENAVHCDCQIGVGLVPRCTMTACGDTTALNQLCNSACLSENLGTGFALECFPGCGGG